MKAIILRRKNLGYGSCAGIARCLGDQAKVVLNSEMKDSDFDGYDIRMNSELYSQLEPIITLSESFRASTSLYWP